MTVFVEVAVNIPRVSGVFHYHLPAVLEDQIEPGQLVEVPFGEQQVQGVLLKVIDEPEVAETKAVTTILDREITLTPHQIKLAYSISHTTLTPLSQCISLMLHTGISQLADRLYSFVEDAPPSDDLSPTANQLLAVLQERGSLRGRQIDRALPRRNWRAAARALVKQGALESVPVLPQPNVRPRYIRTAQLAVPPEYARAQLEGLSNRANVQERRQRILEFLIREPDPVDVSWVYAESGGNLQDLKTLHDKELVILREEHIWRDPLVGLAYDPSAPLPLTHDQQAAWESIRQAITQDIPAKTILLHGVTGSGKTELYLRAVAETLKAGKQAVVLVPEIALTPQTVRRFMSRFPGRVGLVHSKLSPGERYDTWRRARQGKLGVVIGPRSALFSPLPNLGLVVVDESHDGSYYQSGQPPYYHGREAAVELAEITGSVCLLGSATPDLTSLHRARQGEWEYVTLPERIMAHRDTIRAYDKQISGASRYQPAGEQAAMIELPPVNVVDMREELKAGNRSIFSLALQHALADVLNKQQQAIVFLNRLGSATYVFCRDCGHTLTCPRCDTNLTYHLHVNQQGKGRLICHHCSYQRNTPETCPNCGSKNIRHYGMGTEKLESEVQRLFPRARTLRWDRQTTREKGAHEIILSHFSNHRADILVGTQMLAKGLDLPLVTLVGVVLADVGLNLPDFRAAERVFQVLAQVSGRAGRSPLGGQVILQTFTPEHYVIQAAAGHDYAAFSQQELDYREKLGYPPFARLVRMEYRHRDNLRAEEEAERMAKVLNNLIDTQRRRSTEVIGPVPCFYARRDGEYRWQIVLRGPDPASMLADQKLGDWRVETNPQALL
jgi:primosomal protein N' (replication factor Y)